MSKAFTREDDDAPDRPIPRSPVSTLPPGAPNYVTADGYQRLKAQVDALLERRMTLAGDAEAKRRLETQILHLQRSIDTAAVVAPPPQPWNEVRFGALVTVRDQHGEEFQYRIVGVDEADPACDKVNWCSPVARALLDATIGQRVRVQIPAGDLELEILGISYPIA